MLLALPLLALQSGAHPTNRDVRDTRLAMLAIARSESEEARRTRSPARLRLEPTLGYPAKAERTWVRARLGLPAAEPPPGPKSLILRFATPRRLPNGRLRLDASVLYGQQGGFRAHYLVNPAKGPYGTVERRDIFLQY